VAAFPLRWIQGVAGEHSHMRFWQQIANYR